MKQFISKVQKIQVVVYLKLLSYSFLHFYIEKEFH